VQHLLQSPVTGDPDIEESLAEASYRSAIHPWCPRFRCGSSRRRSVGFLQ
jgi:hypothetical protein